MFDSNLWQEIYITLRTNKLRTILTGFSVAWGIFMLIVLLASGTGLENGVKDQFSGDAVNSLWLNAGRTSLPYKGLQANRDIQFDIRDRQIIAQTHPELMNLSGRLNLWDINQVVYKEKSGNFNIRAVEKGMVAAEKIVIKKGRFVNDEDVKQARKVAAVGRLLVKELFGKTDPMGKYIEINGIPFLVVGVFHDEGGEQDERRAYIPVSIGMKTFRGTDHIDQIVLTINDMDESQRIEKELKQLLAQRHTFDPADDKALFVWNNLVEYNRVMGVITGIRIFVWIIGIGTLIAGIVGVSNIMMIAVRERTRELGIRKALGATPGSIIGLILAESIVITSVAGYIGLILGIAVVESSRKWLPDSEFFQHPDVDLMVAIQAVILLVIAGLIAGFFPARKAAIVRPIEALKEE